MERRFPRSFFPGSHALATVPTLPGLPADPDVVIVGAGAAGIGAARRLIAAGLPVASSRRATGSAAAR